MRKYFFTILISMLIGAALTLSFNVSAAVESIIGKQVQGEVAVKLNGAELSNKAAIVDGTSYLPVRSIGESLGLNVDFKNNEVVLDQKPKEAPKVTETVTQTPQDPVKPKRTIEQLDGMIQELNINIWTMKAGIESKKEDDARVPEYKERLKKYEADLAELEKEKAALEQQALTK